MLETGVCFYVRLHCWDDFVGIFGVLEGPVCIAGVQVGLGGGGVFRVGHKDWERIS